MFLINYRDSEEMGRVEYFISTLKIIETQIEGRQSSEHIHNFRDLADSVSTDIKVEHREALRIRC